MLINELTKVFANKIVLFFIMAALLVNGTVIYIEHIKKNEVYKADANAYKRLSEDIADYTDEKKVDYINENLEHINDIIMASTYSLNADGPTDIESEELVELIEEYESGKYLQYTDNMFTERNLYLEIKEEICQTLEYSDYLGTLLTNAEKNLQRYDLSQQNSFDYIDLYKTYMEYSKVKNIATEFSPSRGINMIFDSNVTDILVVISIFFVVVVLITFEREKNLLILSKATRNGGVNHGLVKMASVTIFTVIIVAILYGETAIFAYTMYGLDNMDRTIQSVYGWNLCVLDVKIWQFILIFMGIKLIFFLMCAGFFWLICNISRRSLWVYVISIGIIGGMIVAHNAIPSNSYLEIWKTLNPVSYCRVSNLTSRYKNINIAGSPVNYCTFVIIIMAALVIIFFATGLVFYAKTVEKEITAIRRYEIIKIKKLHTCTFLHELYKVFIAQHVAVIMLLAMLAAYKTYTPADDTFNETSDYYYKIYSEQMAGEYSEDLMDNIVANIEYESEQIEKFSGNDNANKIITLKASVAAWERMFEHMEYLSTRNTNTHTSYLFYDKGYSQLTGGDDEKTTDVVWTVIYACIFTIIIYGLALNIDYADDEIRIIRCTKNGRRKFYLHKIFIGILIAMVMSMIFYFPGLLSYFKEFGNEYLSVSANNMEHLSTLPDWVTIGEYITAIYILRYIGLIAVMAVVYVCVYYFKSFAISVLTVFFLIVIPLLLYVMGIEFMKYILFTPILIGIP